VHGAGQQHQLHAQNQPDSEGGPALQGRFACFAWLALALVSAINSGDSYTQSVKGNLLWPWLAATFALGGLWAGGFRTPDFGNFGSPQFMLLGPRLAMYHGMCITPLAPAQ
jgi:hypothetical protein